MQTKIVMEDIKNPILIIAPEPDSKLSYNFQGKRQEFYMLFLQLKEIFDESGDDE